MKLTIEVVGKVPLCVHSPANPCRHYKPSEVRRFKGTCINRGLTSGACMIAPLPERR